ncbi:hypothetical protein ACFWSJ_24250 [Streptomyces niveus]|uniref:hypothetical protein n=1 Tax=Streptomyces niveus TaxID=193462 RepID=UPI0036690FA2
MIRLVIKVIAAQVIRALDDVSGFRDTYMDALEELIEAKAEGKTPAPRRPNARAVVRSWT